MLAIDFGLKRIGIAYRVNNITLPLEAIQRKNRNDAANKLNALIESRNIKTLIIGVGSKEMEIRIKHFIELLNFKGKIQLINEELSSKEAKSLLLDSNLRITKKAKKKDGKLDSISAMIIMDRYLKSHSLLKREENGEA